MGASEEQNAGASLFGDLPVQHDPKKASAYIVLARKYRPTKLSELIGQEVLAKTLTHAIEQKRMPQAIVLTGIRGVGKTSTARIIARSMLCVGVDGQQNNATTEPCGVCAQCKAIAEDRHPDVMEVDAASRTGVNDMREIIDNVGYRPVLARYKLYIIDEVHMLSKSAFNALLKTLEEPPAHVKFIFATTEVRKIPVTILSRCMRFDLPRVTSEVLVEHLLSIAEKEGASVTRDALIAIARASEGSVRDALSLLDQALAHSAVGSEAGQIEVTLQKVESLLGHVGRDKTVALFEYIASGNIKEALKHSRELYQAGADPLMLVQDLLEWTHLVTEIKIASLTDGGKDLSELEREKGKAHAGRLSIPSLSLLWQMLLKGVSEVSYAPNPLIASEMLWVRLAYAVETAPIDGARTSISKEASAKDNTALDIKREVVSESKPEPVAEKKEPIPSDFSALVALFNRKSEHFIASWLEDVGLVKYDAKTRYVEFNPSLTSPPDLAAKLANFLQNWTAERWVISITKEKGNISIRERREAEYEKRVERAKIDPLVVAALEMFPGSIIREVKSLPSEEIDTNQTMEIQRNEYK